jgi:uroporphyrinogen III methyltransferase/synthase
VRYFIRHFTAETGDIRKLGEFRIAAVGTGTARALSEFHLCADFVPTHATVAELAGQMKEGLELKGAGVVRVQGNLSDNTVPDILTEAGAEVVRLTVYETYLPAWPEGFKENLLADPPDAVMFSSGSTVDGLMEHLSEEELLHVTEGAVIVSIGPMTTRRLRERGMKVTIEAGKHSIPAMVDALVKYCRNNPVGRS